MNSFENDGQGYFVNNQFIVDSVPMGPNAKTVNVEKGKWVISSAGDTWIAGLPSAGGKLMVGDAK